MRSPLLALVLLAAAPLTTPISEPAPVAPADLAPAEPVPTEPVPTEPAPAKKRRAVAAELEGVLRPARVVQVGTATDGILESVKVERGDRVAEGQLLAQLDMSVEEASAELAQVRSQQRAELHSAEIRLKRLDEQYLDHRALHEDGILSAEELRETRMQRDLARVAVQDAREKQSVADYEYRRARALVARGRIESPTTGLVVERFRSPGEVAIRAANEPIVAIAQMDPIVVEAFAPASLLGVLEPGMRAQVEVEAPVEKTRRGRVTVVDRLVDAATGTFGVRIEIPNPDFELPTGLRCQVRVLE